MCRHAEHLVAKKEAASILIRWILYRFRIRGLSCMHARTVRCSTHLKCPTGFWQVIAGDILPCSRPALTCSGGSHSSGTSLASAWSSLSIDLDQEPESAASRVALPSQRLNYKSAYERLGYRLETVHAHLVSMVPGSRRLMSAALGVASMSCSSPPPVCAPSGCSCAAGVANGDCMVHPATEWYNQGQPDTEPIGTGAHE